MADDILAEDVAERIAQRFHETYEGLAPSFGYETRRESAVAWDDVPDRNRRLMVTVVESLVVGGFIEPGPSARPTGVLMPGETADYERGYQDGLNAGRYGCRWEDGGPSRLHVDASPSHAEGAWCLRCHCFEPLNAFGGGYIGGYLIDSGERQPPVLSDGTTEES